MTAYMVRLTNLGSTKVSFTLESREACMHVLSLYLLNFLAFPSLVCEIGALKTMTADYSTTSLAHFVGAKIQMLVCLEQSGLVSQFVCHPNNSLLPYDLGHRIHF